MAKVVIHDFSSPGSFPFEKCALKVQSDATMKRKTPSELRGEQLKRRQHSIPSDVSSVSFLGSGSIDGMAHGVKKLDPPKSPKYIDTRVDEVYPVKKSSKIFKLLYGKEKTKDSSTAGQTHDLKPSGTHKTPNVSECSTASAKYNVEQGYVHVEKTMDPSAAEQADDLKLGGRCRTPNLSYCSTTAKYNVGQGSVLMEKCVQNTFRNVAELSLGGEPSSGPAIIDMDKVLKGLVARELPAISVLSESSGRFGGLPSISPRSFCSSLHIRGDKTPLDFTLKSSMRLVFSSSMNWCHILHSSSVHEGMALFMSQLGHAQVQSVEAGFSLGLTGKGEVLYSGLHSWSYPHSSLPTSVISSMSSAVHGGSSEAAFLTKRQLAWEDSFRSLYYLLRKNMCNIFYLYTSHFVVMFTGGKFEGKMKYSCNAYLSQSTQGLLARLREHAVRFSMPLCRCEVEQATADDLLELSEFEKKNPGQIHHQDFSSQVDRSSQSLLAFIGNENVHGLYDFLLNYRSLLHFLANVDVPVLYSPVPFQNASLCIPEMRCKQIKRADDVLHPPSGSRVENGETSSSGICYTIEIKDFIIPPWIVGRVCMVMGSKGSSFEASFTTDPLSMGLNIALDSISEKAAPITEPGQDLPQNGSSFGFAYAVFDSRLRAASLNSLEFSNGSYDARLSPAWHISLIASSQFLKVGVETHPLKFAILHGCSGDSVPSL